MKRNRPATTTLIFAGVLLLLGVLLQPVSPPLLAQSPAAAATPVPTPVVTTLQEIKPEPRQPATTPTPQQQTRPRITATPTPTTTTVGDNPSLRLEPDDTSAPPRPDVPVETLVNRREGLSEADAAIVPYYNSFLSSYRLGPEDVISITVFGPYQSRYSKPSILIPPDAIISHPLLPDGLFVGGKTTKQVQDDLIKLLDEYIIEPKVTVSLDKAQSAAFAVFGDVGQPGVKVMSRRLSVLDALNLSGGILRTGNKKKVVLLRRTAGNYLKPQYIDVAAIEKGKKPDDTFLVPGDQLVVTGNTLKTVEKILGYLPIVSFFRIFTGGF